jgi:hypothetical protein
MKFLAVLDTHILIVNIELTKVKVSVVINRKWSNLDYLSCHPVGRTQLTFPVTTENYIPCVVRVYDCENWPVISSVIFRQVLLIRSYQGG